MGGREVEGNDSTVILMLSNGYYLFSNIPPHPRPQVGTRLPEEREFCSSLQGPRSGLIGHSNATRGSLSAGFG